MPFCVQANINHKIIDKMKKTNQDYLAPESEVLEMHCSQSIMTTSFTLKELNEDNSDNDFFNF